MCAAERTFLILVGRDHHSKWTQKNQNAFQSNHHNRNLCVCVCRMGEMSAAPKKHRPAGAQPKSQHNQNKWKHVEQGEEMNGTFDHIIVYERLLYLCPSIPSKSVAYVWMHKQDGGGDGGIQILGAAGVGVMAEKNKSPNRLNNNFQPLGDDRHSATSQPVGYPIFVTYPLLTFLWFFVEAFFVHLSVFDFWFFKSKIRIGVVYVCVGSTWFKGKDGKEGWRRERLIRGPSPN